MLFLKNGGFFFLQQHIAIAFFCDFACFGIVWREKNISGEFAHGARGWVQLWAKIMMSEICMICIIAYQLCQ